MYFKKLTDNDLENIWIINLGGDRKKVSKIINIIFLDIETENKKEPYFSYIFGKKEKR
jgi:hypothetical protein